MDASSERLGPFFMSAGVSASASSHHLLYQRYACSVALGRLLQTAYVPVNLLVLDTALNQSRTGPTARKFL